MDSSLVYWFSLKFHAMIVATVWGWGAGGSQVWAKETKIGHENLPFSQVWLISFP